MAFCGNCGAKMADNAKFCINCGKPAAPAPAPVAEEIEIPEIPVSEVPVTEVPVPETAAEPHHKVVFHPEVTNFDPTQERVYQYMGEGKPMVEHVNGPAAVNEPPYVPPVYNNTAYDTPKTPKGGKVPLLAKKRLGFGKGLLVVLLCILLFVSSVGAAAIGTLRLATSPEVITDLVTGISLSDIPADLIYLDAEEDADLIDMIHKDLSNMDPAWEELRDKDLEEYIQSVVLPFVADEVNEVIQDIYNDRTNAAITRKEVQKLLDSSADYLEEECNFPLDEELTDNILTDMDEDELFKIVDMEYLRDEYGDVLDILRWCTSYVTMAICGAVAALCILLLALVTKCPIRTMGTTGGTLLAASIIPGAVALFPMVLPDVWVSLFGGAEYVADIAADLLATGHIVPLAILGGSIFLLILRKILMSIKVREK